ncbi:hypothetical protein B0T25DRAFT_74478 [Lasiosphaeria hispida]|uniref:EamA domain-containing protein n=1 Tax=Lasiosphaeria hispida TaxID=260671 RepID=A0AAJ0MHA5_9PEZI|nr:hypothetical protein B0T25DRAFT_74478 [Lasiosphaeria hispida]
MFHAAESRSGQPLLNASHDDEERGRQLYRGTRRGSPLLTSTASTLQTPSDSWSRISPASDDPPPDRPTFSRRSTMRSRSPATNANLAARTKYTYAAFFLVTSLISFTIQTELAAYIQNDLGWDKAYCMLYLTHGSWSLLWPLQLLFLKFRSREAWPLFWRRHVLLVRTTGQMVERQELDVPHLSVARSPWPYLLRTTAYITCSLTVAGLSWYLAVSMTTPSDLTAIYNCSAFFAYMFSVPLLKERLRLGKSLAVGVAIVGVLVVAYGDGKAATAPDASGELPEELDSGKRLVGNLIIGVGSVLYGLYEVLYKRFACPPEGVSAGRGVIFANTFGSLIGCFTVFVLWIPLPMLHILGIETFELPTGQTAWLLFISVIMNMLFSGSFLVLISLTSPVLSSVAALLTIFIVAIADWMWTGQPLSAAALFGGLLIVAAFVMLSWSTWLEMVEEEQKKRRDDLSGEDDDLDESDKDDD